MVSFGIQSQSHLLIDHTFPNLPEQLRPCQSVSDEYLRVCEEICDLVGDGVKSVPFRPATLNRIQYLQNRRLVNEPLVVF